MAKIALRATVRSLSWEYFERVSRMGSTGLEALTRPIARGTAARITGSPYVICHEQDLLVYLAHAVLMDTYEVIKLS